MYGKNTREKGFTLIELIVVISIVGVLVSIIIVSLDTTRIKLRDAKRLSDTSEIRKILEISYAETKQYPRTPLSDSDHSWNSSCDDPSGWIPDVVGEGFTRLLPRDPVNSPNFCYRYRSNGDDYKFAFIMELPENHIQFSVIDGGISDLWYEIFTDGGQYWPL